MGESTANPIMSLLPYLLISVIFGVVAHFLAKDKGRNIVMWTVLGALPFVNIFCFWYFVGASNLRTEKKIDELISMLNKE